MSNERPSKKEALEILSRMAQDINSGLLDGASNLSGVSHTYIRVIQAVNVLESDTQSRNTHWAIRYLLDKMSNLAGIDTESHGSMADEFVKAQEFYYAKSNSPKTIEPIA